jgi:excisionase family DNA binding protein
VRKLEDKKWLSVKEATEYLSLPSVQALYQAIKREQIPFYRLSQRIRFLRSDLDALFEIETP